MKRLLIVGMAVLCCAALTTRADLISYEGFDYAVTGGVFNLDGGAGWLAPWSEPNGVYCEVVSPGLTYTDGNLKNLGSAGNAWRGSWNGWSYPQRKPDMAAYPYLLTNGVIGAPGTTNWFSFLTKFEGVTAVTVGHFGVVCRWPTEFFGERYWMGARPSGSGVMKTHFTCGGFGAPYTNYPSAVLFPGITYLLVTRVVYNAPSSDFHQVALWTNPLVEQEPDIADAVVEYFSDEFTTHPRIWDTIALAANATLSGQSNCWFYVDEFRFGETGVDVLPEKPSPVQKPTNTSPADQATGVSLTPTLTASAFSSSEGGDVHSKSQFTLSSADGIAFTIDTNALTSVMVPADHLTAATRYFWRVRYLGTNSPKWGPWSDETSFDTIIPTTPTLIAYDGCAYAETPFPDEIYGKKGPFGWNNVWQGEWVAAGFNRVESMAPGLFYQFANTLDCLLTTNNRFRTTEIGKDYEAGDEERILAFSMCTNGVGSDRGIHLLSESNYYGKAGTTNWFSFLARYESGETDTGRFGFDLSGPGGGSLLSMGKPAGGTGWGVAGAGGSVSAVTNIDATSGDTALLVYRVMYGATDDEVSMWINPLDTTQPQESERLALTVPHFEWGTVRIVAIGATEAPRAGLDEFRFGDDWSVIMPIGDCPPESVGTPTNALPADGATGVSVTPTLEASPFDGAGAGDIHTATEVVLQSLGGDDITLLGPGLTNIPVPAGQLKYSTTYSWKVRYLGTNNTAWSDYSKPTSFTTMQGPPQLLAYDGCAYAESTNALQGANGGFGWAGAWESMWYNFTAQDYVQTRVGVSSPGLSYDDMSMNELIHISNRFVTLPYGDYQGTWFQSIPASRSRRTLGVDGAMHLVDSNQYFGVDGTTNWLSFICRYEAGDTGGFFGVELTPLGLASKQASQFVIGKPNGSGNYGLMAQGGLMAASSQSAVDGTQGFLVAELIFADGQDTVNLYVNPELGVGVPLSPDATLNVPTLTYARVGIVSSAGAACPYVGVDELRFGEDWETVTPYIPEPVGACGAVILLALLRRRMK